MHPLAKLDHAHIWHPFTQMQDWVTREPIIIASAKGAMLRDVHGREYFDGNSSIWTNLHGHNHPAINAAINRQLRQVAHTSALGLANEPASILASRLVQSVNAPNAKPWLGKVFFSDDGSTAIEVALKLSYEFTRRTRPEKPRFLAVDGAYHGDTIGAVSLGQIGIFHSAYKGLLFKSDKVPAPYCYRCPFNKAAPERRDAREYRMCGFECASRFERKVESAKRAGRPYTGFVFEPVMQGAAGMIAQPKGWLSRVTAAARAHGAQLLADEVMTGFSRTGPLLACHKEQVAPDFVALAKGLTGGYLPMAATLTSQEVFNAFLGKYEEFKTFFHGHSYTGNQLGSAAALASLDLLKASGASMKRQRLTDSLAAELATLWRLENVGDIRQEGLIAGIEIVRDWRTKAPFDLRERAGIRVCEALAKRGVLTRPIGNVIVVMPPYCATPQQLRHYMAALGESIEQTLALKPLRLKR
ncbi:MAG TPA: adenosylmethionine--8-amino-7-oxononanoate transaminase [Methylomirabilota bacterium]|nr:adenosylmethionine--8-amino-7-oxononanoate transaminase [Methylomirabilota bacterium]